MELLLSSGQVRPRSQARARRSSSNALPTRFQRLPTPRPRRRRSPRAPRAGNLHCPARPRTFFGLRPGQRTEEKETPMPIYDNRKLGQPSDSQLPVT